MMEVLPIDKEKVPYRFQIPLPYKLFEMVVRYNESYDFFTLDVSHDGEVLVEGEKLVYGVPVFIDSFELGFPPLTIVPRDRSGTEASVSYDNVGETLFLVVEP